MHTHLMLGKVILNVLKEDFKIAPVAAAFQYGGIIPDIAHRYRKLSHCKASSFAYIKELIHNLATEGGENPCGVSLRLGIVAHYTCDYFCQAHNFQQYRQLYRHLQYERRLAEEFNKTRLTNICRKKLARLNYWQLKSSEDICQFIENEHRQYLNDNKSMRNDVYYSAGTSSAIVAALAEFALPGRH